MDVVEVVLEKLIPWFAPIIFPFLAFVLLGAVNIMRGKGPPSVWELLAVVVTLDFAIAVEPSGLTALVAEPYRDKVFRYAII